MSTPISRIARLLDEGGRFSVDLPGQIGLDVTSDVIATLAGIGIDQTSLATIKESLSQDEARRDVPTRVQIP